MKQIQLVVIGDLAFQEDILVDGRINSSQSGSAYYCACGASLISDQIGVVARVGTDFALESFHKWKVDTSGIDRVNKGKTARYKNLQLPNGTRKFKAFEGVSSQVKPEIFPNDYFSASYIHLASSSPQKQLIWINYLNKRVSKRTILSVDTFEKFVKKFPDITYQVLQKARMLFINEEEWSILNRYKRMKLNISVILKKGHLGAVYLSRNHKIEIPAPKVKVVDTSGAGEVLAGIFLAMQAQGYTIEKSLEKAVQEASRSVSKLGIEHLHEK